MSEIVQWVIVAAAVAAALVFLIRRFSRPKDACGCADRCAGCELRAKCESDCRDARLNDSPRADSGSRRSPPPGSRPVR